MKKTIDRNVVIVPDDITSSLAITWSRMIANRFKARFVLDGDLFHPHISIYQARYPSESQKAIDEKLKLVISSLAPFDLTLAGFSAFAGVVFWDVKSSLEIRDLHEKTVRALNEVRAGNVMEIHQDLLHLETVQQSKKQSIKLWGNPMCMDEFDPHLSISRLDQYDLAEEAISLLELKQCSTRVDRIWISDIGPDGTCQELLREFRLSE